MSFNYTINGVADLDQRWNSLPGDGGMYCVPTAAMNWMYYYATHGRPNAVFVRPADMNTLRISTNILFMGSYMETDAEDGTSSSDAIDGLCDWLDDRNIPTIIFSARATDNDNITYTNIKRLLRIGANMNVVMGRYRKDGDEFDRMSGHVMTLVSLNRNDADEIKIGVHDPAQDDGDRDAQATRQVREAALSSEWRNIEGDVVRVLRWGASTDPYRFLDGWLAILPLFAVTHAAPGALTFYSADIKTGEVTTKQFPLPFNGDLADLALHPSLPLATVVARGSGEVWTLDLAEGSWGKVAGVGAAQLVAYGGRRQRLFVVKGREIISFDEEGKRLGQLDAGVAVDAISYDQKHDRLLVASDASRRLLSVAPKLQVLGHVEAPEVPGAGRLSLSVNSRDATIVLTRQGSREAATVRWHPTGALAAGRFRLLAEGATAAAHVNRKGRLFVSEAGRIAAFDTDGNRVPGTIFDGLRAGPLLKVARSSNLLDEARSRRKEWKN